MQHVVIVGGGISGLSAAYFLEKRAAEAGVDLSIQLIERRDRLGGVIVSERLDGCLLEGGPDSFLTQKIAALELCRALGLADELIPSNDQQRKTYILQGGELKLLPDGLLFMLPTKIWPVLRSNLFSLSGKMRLAISPLLSPPREKGDVSVAEFISRRLGKQAFDRLAEPLLSAVYGADVNSLSAGAVLQRFIEMEAKHGSLWRAVHEAQRARPVAGARQPGSLFVSLREGVGQLVNSLVRSLARTQMVTGREIKNIRRANASAGFRVDWQDGTVDASTVILAVPSHAAGKVVEPLDPALAEKLSGIQYHSSVTVSLGFEEGSFRRALDGFGFVVARGEKRRMLACTWVSTKFPFRCPPGRVLLRCFLGGARDPSVTQEDDSTILEIVLRELREIMGVRPGTHPEPSFTRIHRWDRAMPQYSVGHLRRIEEIDTLLSAQPGLFLAGNAFKGVGIPDCIDSASLASAAALRYLQSFAGASL